MQIKSYYIILLFVLFSFFSCEEDQANTTIQNIKIGKQQELLTKIVLNPLSEKRVVLFGGDGKYKVNIENSRIASATINYDTLKIKSFDIEGKTYATILSHDKQARLNIEVKPSVLEFSQQKLVLRPTDINKNIALSGGGKIVEIKQDDPQDIIDVKWIGATGIVQITAKYEGEASIIAQSEGVTSKELRVIVKATDDKNFLKDIGVYSANGVSLTKIINPVLKIKRKEMGVLLSATTHLDSYENNKILIKPIDEVPIQGTYLKVHIETNIESSGLSSGVKRLYVESVNAASKQVVLRGKGYKVVTFYDN